MYVCLCHAVTDKAIRKAAASGCSSLAQLRCELGVASQCGKCARQAKAILNEAAPTHRSTLPKQTLLITQMAV
ncbi:bacterioferritin-associated ferredoxin [Gallaecimonas xiamenensis]|uniref:Bacterioferritin-associated ferredoxin n=1 Tax=Gallaecimonas xiamenensis 3-C-1 TaxID=745411 RepID=K2KIK5_9GAMM|nr:bacterioferritin-associated ferredoxin [Gallaecimonas xiamenensis]EKE77085.1 bacterioferritin-associated ferredoxin BFD-like-binding region [Gallaecimonas xiamenensis 3-C-1]